VVAGANPTEGHPVIGARIKQAALRGTPLIVIDPRRIELVDYAEHHLALRPGSNVAVFNAIAAILLQEGLVDRAYLDARVDGLPALRSMAAELDLAAVAEVAGVAPDLLVTAARRIGGSPPVLFVSGLGLSELTQGTASVAALANLGMLTGGIGRPGGGMLPLRGQNNVQGNADMGSMPSQLTGYQPLDDPAARARVERIWGVAPPERPGLTLPEMFDAAVSGELRALWIQGEDVAQSDPNERHVLDALRALDFLVVQEMFLTETARHADLILPAAGYLEQEGTFTNAERRIQHVRPAVAPPGLSRPDWEVVRDAAAALGARWRYDSPAQVMDEIAQIAPDLFGGVSYDRLAADGLQWPCPGPSHPGTASVHRDGFLRGRGLLSVQTHQPSPEHDVAGFPYLLVTGRVLQQYNVGTMTRRTAHRELAPDDPLEIHPDDARREEVGDGDLVELESRWGATRVRARVSPRVTPGTLFLSFHYPETHANRVTGPSVDPDSKCPQYKATAVRVRKR
jgi:predicted molibdopterin-dependent oxidoreductase YjgC